MATSFFPFDAGAGSAISESQWQKMARRWLKSGVLTGYLNALAVTADGSGMTVSVNTGGAWVEGFYFENDAAAAQTIAAAHATLSRIDRIAVRLDRTANTCALVVLTGTAAASPVAPTLSVTDTLYEIGLATVLVDPAVGVIASGKVTDTRTLVKNLTEADASAAYAPKAARAVRAWRSGDHPVPTATLTVIPLNAETLDTDGFHDNAVNPSRITIPAGLGGKYLITGKVFYSAGAGPLSVNLRLNGATFLNEAPAQGVAGGSTAVATTTVESLAAGDYVELTAYQTTGGSLNAQGADRSLTTLSLARIGD